MSWYECEPCPRCFECMLPDHFCVNGDCSCAGDEIEYGDCGRPEGPDG